MKQNVPIIPSVCLSTIFEMNFPPAKDDFQYGRINNPTRSELELVLASLESSRFCAVFSSGSSAIATFLLTLRPGDTVLCHTVMYEGTHRLFKNIFKRLNIHFRCVDMHNLHLVKSSLKPNVTWIFFESPTNPLLEVLDIRSLSDIAHKHNVMVAVDNTLASPEIQKPLTCGADIVIESLTKAINGHSDVIGGLIATNSAVLHKQILFLQQTMGAVLSPFDCFLVLRGLKTLSVRIKEQQNNAQVVLNFLINHKHIQEVNFPGSNSKNEQAIVNKQMIGLGSVISFHLKHVVHPSTFLNRLQIIRVAHSFGGVETTIQQPTQMMNLSFTNHERKVLQINDWLFRLSVGLENSEDITNDLQRALK